MKNRIFPFTLALLLPGLAVTYASAQELDLSGSIDASQEVADPSVESDAVGEAAMTFNPSTGGFRLTVNIVDFENEIIAAHLHNAPAGENGAPFLPLDISNFAGDANFMVGQFAGSIPTDQVGALLAGNVYINIHTEAYPDGEIRGQLMLDQQTGSQMLNFSCRGMVNPGNGKAGILIGGFVIDEGGQTVLMRCIGDGLTKWGLKSLKDTALYVYDVDGNLIAENDNWKDGGQEFNILATGFAPDRDSDAAFLYSFPAGAYTVHGDSNKGAGIALVEMYGISAKSVAGIIDASAHNGEESQFVILNDALKATGLDTVLTGPGPFTLFAPTDAAFAELDPNDLAALSGDELRAILEYHLVIANLSSNALETGPLNTVEGSAVEITVTAEGILVNDADVIGADLAATNGVVHVINKVLIPPAP